MGSWGAWQERVLVFLGGGMGTITHRGATHAWRRNFLFRLPRLLKSHEYDSLIDKEGDRMLPITTYGTT